jgi:GDP-D-mannose dehydratase
MDNDLELVYIVYGTYRHTHDSATYLILRHILGNTHDQQSTLHVSPHDTWHSSPLTNILA